MASFDLPAVARRDLTTADGPIALLETISTGPPVLMVPGYTGSKEDFGLVLAPLAAAGYRVAAMDLRGQFESPGPDDAAAYTVAALARDVRAVLDDLGRPVHLVGHSFGGLVARAVTVDDPAAVVSLVLVGSGPAAIGGDRRERMAALEPVLAAGGMTAVYTAMEQLAAGDDRYVALPSEVKAFLRRRFLASSPVGLQAMGDALRSEPDRVAELRATGVPVLVTYGEADNAWSPAAQTEMARRLGARHVPIPGALHSPAVENPPATIRTLLEFWATADPSRAARPDPGTAAAGAAEG